MGQTVRLGLESIESINTSTVAVTSTTVEESTVVLRSGYFQFASYCTARPNLRMHLIQGFLLYFVSHCPAFH
jgi:hypothetical protein